MLFRSAEAVARAAAERRESRGAHFRSDCSAKVEEWGATSLVVSKGLDGSMTVSRERIPEIPADLRAVIDERQ